MICMKNLRFSSCPRAKVRCQGPLGSARAQPWTWTLLHSSNFLIIIKMLHHYANFWIELNFIWTQTASPPPPFSSKLHIINIFPVFKYCGLMWFLFTLRWIWNQADGYIVRWNAIGVPVCTFELFPKINAFFLIQLFQNSHSIFVSC